MIDPGLIEDYSTPSAAHQLARLPDGRVLEAALDESKRPMLRMWERAIPGVPIGCAALPHGIRAGACVICGDEDDVTVLYSSRGGVDALTLSPTERHAELDQWIESSRRETICEPCEGILLPTCAARTPGGQVCAAMLGRATSPQGLDTVSLVAHQTHHELASARGLLAPVVCCGPDDSMAVAWSDVRRRLHYVVANSGARALDYPGTQPSLAAISTTTWVLAAESEFSQIVTYLIDGDTCRRLPPIHELDLRLKRDVLHSPRLHRDADQRLWLLFVDATRHAVFACQWLGDRWCEPLVVGTIVHHTPRLTQTLRGIKWLKSHADGSEIAFLLQPDSVQAEPRFAAVPRAPHRIEPPHTILFLDMLEVAGMRGMQRVFTEAEKHAGNPVLGPDAARPEESRRVFNFGRVLREDDGRFRMWYAAMGEPPGGPDWWNWLRTGYAESEDGLSWQRTPIPDQPSHLWTGMPYMPAIFKDPHDPQRPYKWLSFNTYGQQLQRAAEAQDVASCAAVAGVLWESPDGLTWTRRGAELSFGGPRPVSFVPQCVIVDDSDPAERYKAYGFSSLTLCRRGVSLATSSDLIHWRAHADNPVLNAELRGVPLIVNGPESQVHDVVIWQHAGLYLALYQYQYGPNQHDIELAVSRDGRRFDFLAPGHKLIARGEAGDWDRGSLTAAVPLIVGDEIWIYYGGTNYHHPSDGPYSGQRSDRMKAACGLARLRLDGFSYLTLADAERNGWVETVALHSASAPGELTVNACIPDGCAIAAELLDEDTREPIPGYTIDASAPATGDSTALPLRWQGQGRLPASRPFRLRVHLRGSQGQPRLFAVTFSAHAA